MKAVENIAICCRQEKLDVVSGVLPLVCLVQLQCHCASNPLGSRACKLERRGCFWFCKLSQLFLLSCVSELLRPNQPDMGTVNLAMFFRRKFSQFLCEAQWGHIRWEACCAGAVDPFAVCCCFATDYQRKTQACAGDGAGCRQGAFC